jgi:hypothetical protein
MCSFRSIGQRPIWSGATPAIFMRSDSWNRRARKSVRLVQRPLPLRRRRRRQLEPEINMKINFARAVAAGMIATLVMTAVGLWIAPLMGMPAMNPADMLAGSMGGSILLGWAAHLMIGIVLALGYAVVAPSLPGPLALRGALYAIAPFLAAQILVMPMMGMPLFSGSAVMAMGSLVGHLAYGAVLGQVYGPVPVREHAVPRPNVRSHA